MSNKKENEITAVKILAPFTGFASARLGIELLPLLDRLSPETAPFGAIMHALLVPAAWALFIIPLSILLTRYTWRYYRPHPAHKQADTEEGAEKGSWYVPEDFAHPEPESATDEEAKAKEPQEPSATRAALQNFAKLTRPFWGLAHLTSILYLLVDIWAQAFSTNDTKVRPIILATTTFIITGLICKAASNSSFSQRISKARSAWTERSSTIIPPTGSYLLSEESAESRSRHTHRRWRSPSEQSSGAPIFAHPIQEEEREREQGIET